MIKLTTKNSFFLSLLSDSCHSRYSRMYVRWNISSSSDQQLTSCLNGPPCIMIMLSIIIIKGTYLDTEIIMGYNIMYLSINFLNFLHVSMQFTALFRTTVSLFKLSYPSFLMVNLILLICNSYQWIGQFWRFDPQA